MTTIVGPGCGSRLHSRRTQHRRRVGVRRSFCGRALWSPHAEFRQKASGSRRFECCRVHHAGLEDIWVEIDVTEIMDVAHASTSWQCEQGLYSPICAFTNMSAV